MAEVRAPDVESLLARARELQAGAGARTDPLGVFRIQRLAARLQAGHGAALARRLAAAIAAHHDRVKRLRSRARADCDRAREAFPESAAEFERLFEAGDFRLLWNRIARLEGRGRTGGRADSLAAVLAGMSRDSDAPELRAVRRFQATWSRLRMTRQLEQSRAQAPRNAGPLNSHHLVLQALEQMRAISPGYLQGFLTGVDALLWLDRIVEAAGPAGNRASKPRAGRRRG